MFAAVVISDIHLIRPDVTPLDIDIELRNGLIRFLPEIVDRFPDVSLILVCGDVAFQALEAEYAAAAGFLRDIQGQLLEARVLVIPGNHDIDLAQTTLPEQLVWRNQLRRTDIDDDQRDAQLRTTLQDDASGPGLFEPLRAYNRFASAYGCDVSPDDPCWTVHLPLSPKYELQIRGMTSVLISDNHDRANGLIVGRMQVADLEAESPGVITLTLCHHPFDWLVDGEWQRARLRQRSPIHITGHDHLHKVLVDDETKSLHLCASALQPTRSSGWDPRVYALGIEVRDDDATALAHIFGARWDGDRFIEDVNEEHEFPVQPLRDEKLITEGRLEASIARLTERLAALPSSNRIDAAQAVAADLERLAAARTERIPTLIVQHAWEGKRLHALWDEVGRLHGNQAGEDNPFGEDQ